MIRPPYDRADVLEKLRPAFAAQRHLILPGACDPSDAPRAPFKSFDLAHRGKYDVAELRPIPELHRFAEALAGRPLKPVWTRLYRFRRGGYSLFLDDAQSRISTGVELTLDLSKAVAGPPAVYQSGRSSRVEVPQLPGVVAIVERNPSIFRYDRYLPAEVGRAAVLRLRAAYEYGR